MGNSGGNYRQAGLPADLAKTIVALINEYPELGFRTLSEFVRHATIEQLRMTHLHLGMRALWQTSELGAEAVEALLRDSLPATYKELLDDSERELDRGPRRTYRHGR